MASSAKSRIRWLLRDADREAGTPGYERLDRSITVKLPPKTGVEIAISSSFPGLFEDVGVGEPPVTKTRAWCFDPGEAIVETADGVGELECLEVEFEIIQRAYPSQVGRLLSYEGSDQKIASVEERDVPLGYGESLKVVISGDAEGAPKPPND